MYRYLDINSYYRNRGMYPNPSHFSLDISDKVTNSQNAVCPVVNENPEFSGVVEESNEKQFPLGSWIHNHSNDSWHPYSQDYLSKLEKGIGYSVHSYLEDSYRGYILQDVFKNRSYSEIELVFLKLPTSFKNSTKRVFYIELTPRTMNKTDLLFSNNRNSKNALFKVLLEKGSSIAKGYGVQTFEYAENTDFTFRIIDEYGELLNIEDNGIPLPPLKHKQISALFRLKLK